MIYFLHSTEGGPIKIGSSMDPNVRKRGIQFLFPYSVEVIATMEGGRVGEKFLHLCFSGSATGAEWFRPTPELWRLMISVVDNGRPAYLPTEERMKRDDLLSLVRDLYGDDRRAMTEMGYSNVTVIADAFASSSGTAFAAKARACFAKALRDETLPADIMRLHEHRLAAFCPFQEAAE